MLYDAAEHYHARLDSMNENLTRWGSDRENVNSWILQHFDKELCSNGGLFSNDELQAALQS